MYVCMYVCIARQWGGGADSVGPGREPATANKVYNNNNNNNNSNDNNTNNEPLIIMLGWFTPGG